MEGVNHKMDETGGWAERGRNYLSMIELSPMFCRGEEYVKFMRASGLISSMALCAATVGPVEAVKRVVNVSAAG